MDISFKGKSAIVTGAAHGIGGAITHGLASRGATVWACDILEDELHRMVTARSATGEMNIHPRIVDVTDKGQVTALVEEASADSGHVDILVCAAGGVSGQAGQAIENVTEEQWQAIYEVNLKGRLSMCLGCGANDEGAWCGPDTDNLQRRRFRRQSDRHPSLCIGEGRPDWPGEAACS